MVIPLVRFKVKVGPKGQIVIPKPFRDAYGIKEGGFIVIEPKDAGMLIKNIKDPEETARWILERKKKIRGRRARAGELAEIDLEEEFDEDIY